MGYTHVGDMSTYDWRPSALFEPYAIVEMQQFISKLPRRLALEKSCTRCISVYWDVMSVKCAYVGDQKNLVILKNFVGNPIHQVEAQFLYQQTSSFSLDSLSGDFPPVLSEAITIPASCSHNVQPSRCRLYFCSQRSSADPLQVKQTINI